ncbi:hypothetical protein HWD03_gp110 [Alteromonas phage vB_AmeM_PT11-V22]|uniref:Uncharacterized protein n=1 Tax=Alteromonas phage vB_AmeM_PT11-V22 TaxID=2704031 RepID=A0A6C0R0N9_9CAUD|nr:hypothetical protein HWD03_gp110 [Alteromonas phage vB_AmeM_PT11-V22]QHZ59789.1 hypothetical protein [Alteromonas phage vB_AmeM_PT11-V22]
MGMTTKQLIQVLNMAEKKINGALSLDKEVITYKLDIENKKVIVQKIELVYKDVIRCGHIGSGRQWKTKSWVKDENTRSTIFEGTAKDTIAFLADYQRKVLKKVDVNAKKDDDDFLGHFGF